MPKRMLDDSFHDSPSRPYSETPEGLAYIEQCCRDNDAQAEFIRTHTREEVAERISSKRRNPRWTRWWEDEPPPPRRWNPTRKIKCTLAEHYGAARGATVVVVCPHCGATGEIRWNSDAPRFVGLHLDHVKPRARGGADAIENLQLLCPSCNFRKGARWEG